MYEMVPVKNDSLKHLTHKNEFLARAKQQPKVIHSFEMLEEMEREVRRKGVTWRAIEQDRGIERKGSKEDTRNKERTLKRQVKGEVEKSLINKLKGIKAF